MVFGVKPEVPSLSLATSLARRSLDASPPAEARSCRLPPPFPPRTPPSRGTSRSPRTSRSARSGTWQKATLDSTGSSRPPKLRGAWAASPSLSAQDVSRKPEGSRSQCQAPAAQGRGDEPRDGPHAELMTAMRVLFDAYDRDRSGSVNLDEFVDTQAEVLAGSAGANFFKQALVAQYLEARTPGHVGLDGAGLDFEGFVKWQLQWQSPMWVDGSEKEVAEHCLRMREYLITQRSAETPSAAPQLPFTSRSRTSSSRRWPPRHKERTPDRPGTTGPKTARRRRYRNGGGMATANKGFFEPPPEVARDIQAYECAQGLKEEGSDDEEYRQRKLAEAAAIEEEQAEIRFIAEADAKSTLLARQLRDVRLATVEALVKSQRQACLVKEAATLEEMQRFVAMLAERNAGKITLRGCVAGDCGETSDASVALQEVLTVPSSKQKPVSTAKPADDGFFKLSTEVNSQKGGSNLLLVSRHRAAADYFRNVAGEGARRLRIELLKLNQFQFKASAGSEPAAFEDPASGARFRIPAAHVLKGGQPFAGQVMLSFAVVMPDFGTMGRALVKLKRKDNAKDAALVAASHASALASAAAPARRGRSLSGTQMPLMLAGAVFTKLTDAGDGSELSLQAGSQLEVDLPCHSLALRQLMSTPSVWRFDADLAEWCQSTQPLSAGEQELPQPAEPEVEIHAMRLDSGLQAERPSADSGFRRKALEASMMQLRLGHEAWVQHLKREGQAMTNDSCYCGFRAKQAILHHLHKHHPDLHLTQPPKRLFATIEPDDDGFRQTYPCRTPDDIAASAERAAAHPEVLLSHHLTATLRCFDPSPEIAKDMCLSQAHLFTRVHYEKVSGRVLPHLRHVAAFLVAGSKAIQVDSNQEIAQVPSLARKLVALEFLVNCWIRPRSMQSAPCTLQEVWEALQVRGGDVATALLVVALQQAHRDEAAEIRKQLRSRNKRAWASHHELLPVVIAKGSRKECSSKLAEDALLRERARILELKQLVEARSGRCPRTERVRLTLQSVDGRISEALSHAELMQEAAQQAQLQADQASQELASSSRALRKAVQQGNPTRQLQESQTAKVLSRKAAEKQEEADKFNAETESARQVAEREQTLDGPAGRLVEELDEHGTAIKSDTAESQKTWQQVLDKVPPAPFEYGYANALRFSFAASLAQWQAVGATEAAAPAESEPQEASAIIDKDYFCDLPETRLPVLRTSTMVMGYFDGGDEGVMATEVSAGTMGTCGMTWAQVEADGTFCLLALAKKPFELWVTLAAPEGKTLTPLRCGPFMARSCDEVTFLGTLRPGFATTPGEWRNVVSPPAVFISLPRIEVAGTAHEKCTCDVLAFLEGTETSLTNDELSKDNSKELSKELSRLEAAADH